MNCENDPSFLTRLLSVIFFSILTLSSFTWFFVSVSRLVSQLLLNDPVVIFDKGAMYMLGVGIGLLILTVGGVMQGIFRKDLSYKIGSMFKRGLIVSVIVMVVFPQLAQHIVDNIAREKNYDICDEVTYNWVLYSKYYYTNNKISCQMLAQEKEITKSSSGR